jgi:hypothetical protein
MEKIEEECDCTCHADPDTEVDAHLMACCMPCTHCCRRIEAALWAKHSEECAREKAAR